MKEYRPEDYIQYRIQRAWETLEEVQVHIDNKFWNTAVNRMYYACFYSIGALLVQRNIEASSHSGIRQKFGEHFVKTGIVERELAKHFADLFEKRQKADYNDFFDYDEETVVRLYPLSKQLIEQIEKIINNYRSK